MPVQDTMQSLTAVASSNSPAGSDSISNTLDDYLRSTQAILRQTEAVSATMTTTASMTLAALTGGYVPVIGTDAITHLGSAVAGTLRTLKFAAAATLTHNATNLILPTGGDIITAAGDVAMFRSEGSGNWRCVTYLRASGAMLGGSVKAAASFAKSVVFDSEIDNGTFTSTTTIDWTSGNKQTVMLGANITFDFVDPPTGATNLILRLVQDGAGSRTAAWPASVKWPAAAAPVVSTGAGDEDIVTFYWNGTSYYGARLADFG